MSATPHFSIITAVRNAGEALPSALASVAGQRYAQVEHVVVDGGSTDGTVEALKRATQDRLRWISEPDRGISHAFNKGIGLSGGNVLLFLGADDRLVDRDTLQDFAGMLARLPRPWVVYGDCQYTYPRGKARLVRDNYSFAKFRKYNCLPHQALFVDREIFSQFGLFDESYGMAMDYEQQARFVAENHPVYVPRLVSEMSRGGVSTQAALAHREMNRVRIAKGWTTPVRAVWRERWAALASHLRRLSGRGW